MTPSNLPASIRARLLNLAHEKREDFNLTLTHYALERLLYRLSISPDADDFLLKGALLFDLWFSVPHRSTRDADLLGLGPADASQIEALFTRLCQMEVEDGLFFDETTLQVTEIRKSNGYGGLRVRLFAKLKAARSRVQVDIGFGDAVVPAADWVTYPTLLSDSPAPRLRVYPIYTVVAEKFQAAVALGEANTRMKDFFDLDVIIAEYPFNGELLCAALAATFDRRDTPLPASPPTCLTREFAEDPSRRAQWQAFLRKNRMTEVPFPFLIGRLEVFFSEPLVALRAGNPFNLQWTPGTGWD